MSMRKGLPVVVSAIVAMVAGLLVGPASPASAATGSGYVKVRHSGQCLDVPASSTVAGVGLTQWPCTGNANQSWRLVPEGLGASNDFRYFSLVNEASGLCVDVPASQTTSGIRLIQWTCTHNPNQQWEIESTGSGYGMLRNRNSWLCMDVFNSSLTNGAAVQQFTCNATQNQQFNVKGAALQPSGSNGLSWKTVASAACVIFVFYGAGTSFTGTINEWLIINTAITQIGGAYAGCPSPIGPTPDWNTMASSCYPELGFYSGCPWAQTDANVQAWISMPNHLNGVIAGVPSPEGRLACIYIVSQLTWNSSAARSAGCMP